MSSFHDDDGMEALRAHCQQIEASQSANKSSNPTSDGSQWFDSQEPLKAIERDDTEAWKRLQVGISLRKVHWDINGKRDSAAAAKIASLNQKESKTMTPISQEPEVPREVRFSIRGPRFTSYNLMRQRLAQQQNMHAAAAARYAAMEAGKKLLQEANEAYEQAYVENLRELEYGLSCFCNRYPWQHELHPSGTAKRDRERQQQREDEDMRNRDGARP